MCLKPSERQKYICMSGHWPYLMNFRVLINSFNLMDEDYLPIGIGLYLQASVLDHSCWPNATVVFSGNT